MSDFLTFKATLFKADVPNKKGDFIPSSEFIDHEIHKTIKNKALFSNAVGLDNVKGKVIEAHWNPITKEMNIVCILDQEVFPMLARGIRYGYIDGIDYRYSVKTCKCSVCSHIATRHSDYCDHMKSNTTLKANTGIEFIGAILKPSCGTNNKITGIIENGKFKPKPKRIKPTEILNAIDVLSL